MELKVYIFVYFNSIWQPQMVTIIKYIISYIKQNIPLKDIRPYIGDIFLCQEVWDTIDDDWEKK